MEKIYSGKAKNRRKELHKLRDADVAEADDQDESLLDLDLHQISTDIDSLADDLSTVQEKGISPEIPDTVDTFLGIMELRITKGYNSIKPGNRFGNMTEDDEIFIEGIRRLSKLKIVLGEFSNTTSSFNRTQKVLQQAMVLLEEEFRALLEDSTAPTEPMLSKAVTSKSSSSKSDPFPIPTPDQTPNSNNEQEFPGYSKDNIIVMNKIASIMIPAGYQYECCQAYNTIRKDGLQEQVKRFEFEKVNVEDIHKSKWASLEPDITRWVKLTRHCSNVLFPAERKLGETVFSDNLTVFTGLFVNLLRNVTTLLMEYATALETAKPKAKRLFKFLEVYEASRDLGESVGDSGLEESCNLKSEISSVSDGIGETVVNMFNDLKNFIRNDANKPPVQGGAVHPLTRYVTNYIRCAFDDYRGTLEQVLRQHMEVAAAAEGSILSKQLMSVIELLESNLQTKAALYKDQSLRYIFLMNNDRYILQVVKGMKGVTGDTWCRRKSSDVRNYHKSYQRETWNRLLQCITQEGVQVNGKPNRRILKERFKTFNAMFDDIYKSQSTWVVSDEQLLSEIRVSITAVVSPAYRSFVGRYKPQFEGPKSIDKYIKYQPEDIEAFIETLFEGTEKVDNQANGIQAVSSVKHTTGAFKNLLKTYKSVGLM